MIKYLQLPFQFEIDKLKDETQKLLSQKWQMHYNSQQYEGNWEALPLRSVNGDINNILALDGSNHFEDTQLMEHATYIKQVVNSLLCPKLGIRLLNLKAGAVVHAHSDHDLYFEQGEARLHVPIVTNSLVEFYLDEERIVMDEGECWYMNLAMMHRLHNKSSINRIHLVIDCKVNDWLQQQFANATIAVRKEVADFPKKELGVLAQKQIIEQLRLMNTETATKMADEMEAALQ